MTNAYAGKESTTYLSPKFSLRTGGGIFTNSGTLGGSINSVGAFNVLYVHYMTTRLAVAIGYKADFDMTRLSMPVRGIDIAGRWYYLGRGTKKTVTTAGHEVIRQDTYALYLGGELSEKKYFFSKVATSATSVENLSGDYGSLNILLGADYTLNDSFEWNVEACYGLFTFSQTDERVRFQAMSLATGLSYLF